jgi:hypothetical protein
LTYSHETAGCDECSKIPWDNVELLEEPEVSLALLNSFGFCNMGCDVPDLLLDLLWGSLRKDGLNNHGCLLGLIMIDELTR